jgi:hypothetical protein
LVWTVPAAAMLAAILVFGFDSSGQHGTPAPAVAGRGADLNPESTGSVNPAAGTPRSERTPPAAKPAPAQPGGEAQPGLAAQGPAVSRSAIGETAAPAANAGPMAPSAAPGLTSPPLASRAPARPLSSEAIDEHLARGEHKLRAGEVATARLYFERVVQAGDPRGALAMGRSYDPAVLSDLPLIGPQGDAETARTWYERAASLQAGLARPAQ